LRAALKGDATAKPDDELAGLWREYRFRKAFGCSHEEFLDQPTRITDWLLALDNLHQELSHGE